MQRWCEEHPRESWETLVQQVDDKVRENERVEREESEMNRRSGVERVVRGVQRFVAAPSCAICGRQGHRGYQCEGFPEWLAKKSGNE